MKEQKRYDLVTNYRAGSAIEEMERSDDGEWIRFEDVEADLAAVRAQLTHYDGCAQEHGAECDCGTLGAALLRAEKAEADLTALRAERDNLSALLQESKQQFVLMQKQALHEVAEARQQLQEVLAVAKQDNANLQLMIEQVQLHKDELAAARARLAVPAWQPIETAPKDGSQVLVWDDGAMFISWWNEEEHAWIDNGPVQPPPTHWMPLPPPPAAQGETR